MTVSTRRVWRAAPTTLILVSIFAVLAAIGIPLLGYTVYSARGIVWLPALLGGLTVITLLYVWRFGLHPSLRATDSEVVVRNPFRTVRFLWEDITLIAPGENGLLIGSEETQAEAWCIQKSNSSTRKGQRTRSDQIVSELHDLLDQHEPPVEDSDRGLRLRRARPDESRLLTRLERAASEAGLMHVFPPEEYPYPTAEVLQRWRGLLRDRLTRIHILELADGPVGFVAFTDDTVRHLGVVEDQARRGFGSVLLGYATSEIFARHVPAAQLWVLDENHAARSFYQAAGWQDTDDRRKCEFPPYPLERRMCRVNPRPPRRRREE